MSCSKHSPGDIEKHGFVSSMQARMHLCMHAAATARTRAGLRAQESVARMHAGAKGPLVEEEAKLLRLRQEVEGEAREELQRRRQQLEDEARWAPVVP